MKKVIYIFLVLFIFLVGFRGNVYSACVSADQCKVTCQQVPGCTPPQCFCPDGEVITPPSGNSIPKITLLDTIGDLITKVSGVVTPLAVLGFIFTVIYAGFIRMTASGNAEKEAKSMKVAVGAAIGFAIIALAPLLVKLLSSLLNLDPGIIS